MKKTLMLLLAALCLGAAAQPYSSYNVDLLSVIAPDTNNPKSGNRYSGCWGWYQASKNKEYALSGGRSGTWFIDVTNPNTPSVSAYVPAASKNCTWRELKTYSHYCYIVSDVCRPNAFQIVDMQYLPDSVHVVHSDTSLFTLGHTIWIDKDKMYVAATNFGAGGFSPMSVWSLANPEQPTLIRRIEQDDFTVNEVHDMFVRNDTIYASAGWQGLRVYVLKGDSIEPLGSYSGYHGGAYNHSSYLTANGKHLVFCDEVPQELPIKAIDVQNLQNIQPVQTWIPHPRTTPHNPYIKGNDWAYVASYQDGLFIYDLRNLPSVFLAGSFDTHHQGGFNVNSYGSNAYQGNWGAYPFLPSGVIIAQDMQNGVFLLDASAAYVNPLTVVKQRSEALSVFPNPATQEISIRFSDEGAYELRLTDMLGRQVKRLSIVASARLDVSDLPAGTYVLTAQGEEQLLVEKIVVGR